jgi:hypothetical protein
MVTAAAWMAFNMVQVVGDVNGHGGCVDEHGGRWVRCEQWAV